MLKSPTDSTSWFFRRGIAGPYAADAVCQFMESLDDKGYSATTDQVFTTLSKNTGSWNSVIFAPMSSSLYKGHKLLSFGTHSNTNGSYFTSTVNYVKRQENVRSTLNLPGGRVYDCSHRSLLVAVHDLHSAARRPQHVWAVFAIWDSAQALPSATPQPRLGQVPVQATLF